MKEINPYIFRQYDIRGYGTFLRRRGPRTSAISGDIRLTTPALMETFSAGIRRAGIDIIDPGKRPTPANYYSCLKLPELDAAVRVTGSHNPPEFNGCKLTLNRGPAIEKNLLDLQAKVRGGWNAKMTGRNSESPITWKNSFEAGMMWST